MFWNPKTENVKFNIKIWFFHFVILLLRPTNQALRYDPRFDSTLLVKVSVLQTQDKWDESVKLLEEFCRQNPGNGWLEKKLKEAKFEVKKRNRPDFYKLLGINSNATSSEIKRGYREKAMYW